MIIELTSCKFSCVRWNSSESKINKIEDKYIVGSTLSSKELKVYKLCKFNPDNTYELLLDSTFKTESNIKKLLTFGKSYVACAMENGSATIFSIEPTSLNYAIKEVKTFKNLSKFSLTDIAINHINKTIVFSSENGILFFVDYSNFDKPVKSSKEISKTSLTCLEILNQNELICGNECGNLKLFDSRSFNVTLNLVQNLSSINCVRRHISNGHIIACGNDSGHLSIIDLRNSSSNLQLIAAHEGAITELKYKNADPNTILTSSLDGELLKWNFTVDNSLIDVQCLFGSKRSHFINSFDLNDNWLTFTTDLEALYCIEQ